MENLKVRVKNEAESKEVQELFFELGFGWRGVNPRNSIFTPSKLKEYFIISYNETKDMQISGVFDNSDTLKSHKELTISQLKDLVVLKRNSIDDATHTGEKLPSQKGYLTNDGVEYFWNYCLDKWNKLSKLTFECQDLKPIEKKEMKEYLRKNNDGEYILEVTDEREAQEPHAKHWIEVPKGCDYLISNLGVNAFTDGDMFAKVKPKNVLWSRKEMKEFLVNHDNKWTLQLLDADTEENSFRVAVPSGADVAVTLKPKDPDFKHNGVIFYGVINGNVCCNSNCTEGWEVIINQDFLNLKNDNLVYIWQRHTHPEELPFVDDEPKHSHYFRDVSDIEQMDVYEVLKRFEVADPCLQHIVKKALCAGQRGYKDFKKDLQDILDTAVRAVDINK